MKNIKKNIKRDVNRLSRIKNAGIRNPPASLTPAVIEREGIHLPSIDRALCGEHLSDFIPEKHPSGVHWITRFIVFSIESVKRVLVDPRFVQRTGGLTDPAVITATLDAIGPLCCFMTPEDNAIVREKITAAIETILAAEAEQKKKKR